MPGPNGASDTLVQDLYPYADPTPVTFTAPGQRYFENERTVGGWFVASTALKDELIAVGLPEAPSTGSPAIPRTSIEVAVGALLAAAAALGAILLARAAVAGRAARDDLIRSGTISLGTPRWRARPGR